jgi:hypothetical protein
MTFLNPIFLWASFAILVPIVIHLFNFRRPKKVLFSDISFVKEVKKSVVKKLRLRQILLLIARCLAILAMVFMFANPVWRPFGMASQAGQASVCILVDNSYSMQAGNDRGVYWVQAQTLAREIIEAHGKEDEFLVSGTDAPKLYHDFVTQQVAIKASRQVELSQNTQSLQDLLDLAPEMFSKASFPNRKLYLISDFQKSTVLPDSVGELKIPDGISLNLIPLTTRKIANVHVSNHEIATQIIEAGKPLQLKLNLVNDGTDAVKNLNLRVVMANENRPVATQDLAGGSSQELEVMLLPKNPGWQSGYIEIDDYPVDFDNKRYFSFYVPFREKMLVVEGKPAPHLKLMFGGEIINQFAVEFRQARDFGSMNLDAYKSIVLVGVEEYSSGMQEKLKAHLAEGKSLMIFPSEGMKLDQVNGFLQTNKIGSYGKLEEVESGVQASDVDLDHPLFEGVFQKDRTNRKFDSPNLFRFFPFKPDLSSIHNVVMAIPGKKSVLVETKLEKGLVYVCGFFPGSSWTDFTLKSSGLALMVQISRMMNQTQQGTSSLEIGSSEPRRVKTQVPDVVKLVGNKAEITPEQHAQNGYVVLRFDKQSFKEGNYDLMQGENKLEAVSFNVADKESKLQGFDEQNLREKIEKMGLPNTVVSPGLPAEVADAVKVSQNGIPLWKYGLMLALLCLLLEILMIRFWNSPSQA